MKSLLTAISLALTFVSPAYASIEWSFPNDSGSYSASGGSGLATINASAPFSTGYHNGSTIPWTLGGVPEAVGLWDLGKSGSIMLSGLSASGPVTLTVFQWVDSPGNNGPYSGVLIYSVNGGPSLGSLSSVTQIGSAGADGGAWWEYAANLNLALTPADTVTVTAGAGGAIIDRLTLVPEPATMLAGAVLLIPFALSTWPILRRRRTS
jgi:hypothetical protein